MRTRLKSDQIPDGMVHPTGKTESEGQRGSAAK